MQNIAARKRLIFALFLSPMTKRLLLGLLLLPLVSSGQVNVDSLRSAWNNTALHDTLRLQAVYSLGNGYFSKEHPDSALIYADLQIEFARKKSLPKWEAFGLNIIGLACRTAGKWTEAIDAYEKAMRIFESIDLKKNAAIVGVNLGTIYFDQGDYNRSLESYTAALEIFEQIEMKNGVAACLGNLANIYIRQKDFKGALITYEKCMLVFEELGDRLSVATTLVNIGNALESMERNDEAILKIQEGRRLFAHLDDKQGMAGAINNIGTIFLKTNRLDSAIIYFDRAYALQKEMGNMRSLGNVMNNMASVHLEKGEFTKGIPLSLEALSIAKNLGAIKEQSEAAQNLYLLYKKTGRAKESLEMHELYVQMLDSLVNESNAKAIMQQQFQYEFDKKEALLQLVQERQNALSADELARKDFQRNTFFGGFFLMLTLAIIAYRNFSRKKKDNRMIKEQKQAVEQKNVEILQSIAYARRLQEAVLPSAHVVKDFFDDSFLLYLPKEIVSGDFYWMDNHLGMNYFAVGGCTVHGVPGAMLSVLSLNGLNRCLTEFDIKMPDKILSQLMQLLNTSFEHSEAAVQDGISLAVCALDRPNNKVYYAGSNIALNLVRRGELTVYGPDTGSVGFSDRGFPFTGFDISIETGDTLYLSTDGYRKQENNEGKLLFSAADFTKHLSTLSGLSMAEQRSTLLNQFKSHQGDTEQTGDICIMAVRI